MSDSQTTERACVRDQARAVAAALGCGYSVRPATLEWPARITLVFEGEECEFLAGGPAWLSLVALVERHRALLRDGVRDERDAR